jgi:purine-nucleoside phosphorylase
VALVLGSGLGGLSERIEGARRIPYAAIPGFAVPSVEGHRGELVAGMLGRVPVLAFAGRFHVYEGHNAAQAAFPVRLARALGASVLFLSNAAGGVRRTFRPGDLMAVADHVNFMWRNPLLGPVVPGDERFPDMSQPYDPELRAILHRAAAHVGVLLHDGVYAALSGPSYETPAEVRMLERLGVDAVGMSTVPEVLVARAIGMRVVAASCITNLAAGLSEGRVDHQEVLRTTAAAAASFQELVLEFLRLLPP